MDEAALRNMLPTGFGKMSGKPSVKGKAPVQIPNSAQSLAPAAPSDDPPASTSLASRILAVRKTKLPTRKNESYSEHGDDGLTPEEREANEKLDAQANQEDDDTDEDDLGPEPEDSYLPLPIDQEATLRDHSKVGNHLSQ